MGNNLKSIKYEKSTIYYCFRYWDDSNYIFTNSNNQRKRKGFVSGNNAGKTLGIQILDDGNYKYIQATKPKDVEITLRILDTVLTEYFDKGYKIVSATSGGATYVVITTYILKKD